MKLYALILVGVLLASCGPKTKDVNMNDDRSDAVMALDHRDFTKAADTMIKSLLNSKAFDKADGSRFVVALSTVKNDTMQRIDTSQLTAKIRRDLLNSGKFVMTTAVGTQQDNMNTEARKLRQSAEFNQATVQEQGQLVAPDLSLAGKIFQRNIKLDNGDQQVEYYFTLMMTELKTGLALWEDEVTMGKRGSGKSATW
ncbi:penicillin-binding protein activator LpoB [Lentisphaera profundi]|jgi:uncharacterized protein (TIGR02722 family)|uniref:Penicillin-binding protein activator LpoB n=1 Tax=Lentisphaera profundi TaxID=1658616 RepID=A0ABY7VSL6_9BACT|nr:penicillin-binding protein activator LpoB [Lentisphaera profundi]WDE96739.1 penicillin-binding protein activator LpoB [Lentisphaera profundi]